MFFETIDYTKNKDVDYLSSVVTKSLKGYEINSFMLGIKIEEEGLLKKELHLLLIEAIKEKTSAEYKTVDYDVEIIVDLTRDVISFEIRPAYVYGRYCKYSREIAQTYHYCYECRGKGCSVCNYTGKKTKTSVQEILFEYLKDVFVTKDNKFHGAGREDVDVLMLGKGREFVIELLEPKKRNFTKEDLKKLEEKINKENSEKISVSCLEITNKEKVVKIKQEPKQKTYEAVVSCDKEVDLSSLKKYFERFVVKQKTPTRVKKRRADKVRERECVVLDCEKIKDNMFSIKLLTDAGLYIKEFISGDEDRSDPSLSQILECSCVCESLNVVDIS